MSKNIFKSKTFWVNVLSGGAALLAGPFGIHVPTEVAIPATAAINIALRWITRGPVHIFD